VSEHPEVHADEPAPARGELLPALAPVAEARPIERGGSALLSAPAVATGGFLAGVATFTLLRGIRARGVRGLLSRRRHRRAKALEVTGTRSFLVDIHLLKR